MGKKYEIIWEEIDSTKDLDDLAELGKQGFQIVAVFKPAFDSAAWARNIVILQREISDDD